MIRPVFAFPPLPEDWSGPASRLIRIVDPAGDAIAWLDPLTGTCAGYAVRESSREASTWRHILVGTPAEFDDNVPNPTRWNSEARWRFVERDPASCTLESEPDFNESDQPVSMTASLDDGALSLSFRLPSFPLRTPMRLTLACTSRPSLHRTSPGRVPHESDSPPSRAGDVVIAHDTSFVAPPIRTITLPGGSPRFIVTLDLLPVPASTGRGDVSEQIVRISVLPT